MASSSKKVALKVPTLKAETSMDKTSRIVRKIMDEEAELRQVKISRLRNARLDREANTLAAASPKKDVRKKADTKK